MAADKQHPRKKLRDHYLWVKYLPFLGSEYQTDTTFDFFILGYELARKEIADGIFSTIDNLNKETASTVAEMRSVRSVQDMPIPEDTAEREGREEDSNNRRSSE